MVWIPNEERWSVELINDRGLKVRDFSWNSAGSAALIIYEDSFILVRRFFAGRDRHASSSFRSARQPANASGRKHFSIK